MAHGVKMVSPLKEHWLLLDLDEKHFVVNFPVIMGHYCNLHLKLMTRKILNMALINWK